jgi:hypothetical protein
MKLLERLRYTSKATEPFGTLELFKLLNHARQKNARFEITGHLLYANGLFTQCVEGPAESIERLWRDLQNDHRHCDIHMLDRTALTTRQFSEWSMAFSSYRYLNAFNMPGFFPIDADGVSIKSALCQG